MMDPQGNQSTFKGGLRVTEWVKAEHSSDPDYPASGVWHPNRWEFTLDSTALSPGHSSLAMVPVVPAQTGPFGAGQEYMKGATMLLDAQGTEVGRGFGEATGYYRENDTTLRLARLPVTAEMRKLVQRQARTVAEKIVAEGYSGSTPHTSASCSRTARKTALASAAAEHEARTIPQYVRRQPVRGGQPGTSQPTPP